MVSAPHGEQVKATFRVLFAQELGLLAGDDSEVVPLKSEGGAERLNHDTCITDPADVDMEEQATVDTA